MDPLAARIVIVGAGQAGASMAAKLRALGHTGPLTLIGAEADPPYQRPPLSKAYFKGEMERERLQLRPPSFYTENRIALRTGCRVAAIDPEARSLTLESGETLGWDRLALTLGATPRRLPAGIGGDLANVFVMRDLRDADALAQALETGARRALIVGGGYIGLEAAAVLREKGLEVTVIEAAPRILARVAAPATADFFRDLHQSHGVEIREGAALTRLSEDGAGRVTGGDLADGTAIPADLVLVGIGVAPNTALAEVAGLAVADGIVVDAAGRTSVPGIYAAGDCARFPYRGEMVRIESVPNAIDQAEAVAGAMLDQPTDYLAKPWFWSDQYAVKLQIAGLNTGYARTVTRPGTRPGTQSVWYYAGETLLAVDAMNDPRAYMTAKRWIEAGLSPDAAQVADPATELKGLA